MKVDRAWGIRNLGIDEGLADMSEAVSDDQDLQRELIDFDSQSPSAGTAEVLTAGTGMSKFVDIKWPKGVAPKPGPRPKGTSLPKCDVLVVTWTVEEGHALSRVLTPGFDSHDDWKPYRKNFARLSALMVGRSPARQYGRLGTYWTTRIGTRQVTLFKSDSHMSQDGPKLANAQVWKQIIEDSEPRWVITTGTGGGIGRNFEVGDIIVSRFVAFDCKRTFKRLNSRAYANPTQPPTNRFAQAQNMFARNAGFLPSDNRRQPRIVRATKPKQGVLTTDYFGFDNTDNTYGLQGKGDLSEMGDAVLGMVCANIGQSAPDYVIVRNVSDPEIDSTGLTLAQQKQMAADIYKRYGRWSSVCSAMVCWAIAASI